MSPSNASKKRSDFPIFLSLPRYAGAVVALLGGLIIISWYAHWRPILQPLAETAPIHFNTALCFILSGLGLFLRTFPRPKIVPLLAGISFLIALLTLLEYLTGRDFNLDQFFYQPFFDAARVHPGRMSPVATLCFLFTNTGILLTCFRPNWPQRLTLAGMFASIVAATALLSLFGFILGIQSAYGWGAYSSMAVNSAIGFLALNLGLLVFAWQTARQENFNFLRWLPITASVTLMTMVAFVGLANTNELKSATYWRQHTFQVILSTQAFDDNLIDMQRGVRGYVTLQDTNALATYENCRQLEPKLFADLITQTSDNAGQTGRLKNTARAMDDVLAYDQKIITLYNQGGSSAVTKSDATGESRRVFGKARDSLKAFRQMEQNLLGERDAIEQADYGNTSHLLVFGSLLAALLLMLANKMATRELHFRVKVEQELLATTTMQNAIFDSANYAIIALEPDGIVRTFNPAAERMLGYAADEIIGKVTPMIWRDKTEVAAEAKRLSLELGYPVKPGIDVITSKTFLAKAEEYEATYIRKNGRRFPVLVSLTPLTSETGKITGFLGVIADITERKRAEEKIRESEERFRSALDNAPIGMALVSLEGRWLKVNHALLHMLGYSETELLTTDFQHLTHPEDLKKDLDLLQKTLEGTIPSYQIEKRYFHKSGDEVSVMLSVSVVRDEHQKPLYFVSQVENITERKLREAEREKLIQELQQALAEVRTLSGMIPICGWCKSVRSDEGYWQTVEQYVRDHTEATFTHGMCPKCTEKFKADIQKANPPKPA